MFGSDLFFALMVVPFFGHACSCGSLNLLLVSSRTRQSSGIAHKLPGIADDITQMDGW